MIVIIDYGMGNLRSVQKGLEKVGFPAEISHDPKVVETASGVVLPGVGAFKDAMKHLRETGLDQAAVGAIESGRPFLGICLGLQLLFTTSYEDGTCQGLGVFGGTVERLPAGVKIPHMGWNQIKKVKEVPILAGLPDKSDFYFVHSYIVKPDDPSITATLTDYGINFTSGVWKNNLYAFQFHPEKSSKLGLQILKNFGEMCQ